MKKKHLEGARQLIGQLVENEGADAIVLVYSKVYKRKTETYIVPYGNAHTCNALIDYAYDNFNPPELYLNEEDSETERDE